MAGAWKIILEESITFLEICQESIKNGKIDFNQYDELTRVKWSFIKSIIGSSEKRADLDKDTKEKLNKIHFNEFIIQNSKLKSASK